MKDNSVINVLAVAITVAAWGGLRLLLHPGPPAIDRRAHEAVGEVLAAEAAKVLQPGARLVVIARAPKPCEVPASAAQLTGFLRTLKQSGLAVTSMHEIKLDPLRRVAVPPGDFYDLLRLGRDNDVIVSFLGPPAMEPAQLAKLGNRRPRVLAVCAGSLAAPVNLRQLFQQRLLVAAVVSRDDAPAHSTARNKRLAFEQMFKLITPANLAELPAASVARN
jgi:hypothetical protein